MYVVEIASYDCGRYKEIVKLHRESFHQGDDQREEQFEGLATEGQRQIRRQENS